MKIYNRFLLVLLLPGLMLSVSVNAQEAKSQNNVIVDYATPKEYVLADVDVKGVRFITKEQILSITGLVVGERYVTPGGEYASVVKRLMLQRFFSDVDIRLDSIKGVDSAYVSINLIERPRVSLWDYTGIKKSERQDLDDRLKLRRRSELSDFILKSSCDIIKRYYLEKGFLNVQVTTSQVADTLAPNAVRVYFNVDRGSKVKIKTITFEGNEHVKTQKLRFAMKKTKDKHILNFFSSKKFNEKEYPNDKQLLIEKLQEKGFYDARIVRDTVYQIDAKHLHIDIQLEEGRKYYFRNITWTGNSVFTTEYLNRILRLEKGDVFDVVTLEKRLLSASDGNIFTLYQDNGYLFCNIQHVEHTIVGDSIDVEMRIFEGKPGTFDRIVINGNSLTNEQVIRRQLYINPGQLYAQTNIKRSIQELAGLKLFNEEKLGSGEGLNISPNMRENTVDVHFNVEEKPSSQLEVAGGWGGNTFVGTLGVSFNNFSTRRLLHKDAWRPVPLGDGQTLSLRFQTNGTYYTALSASFMEPWLFGKKPTSLSLSAYFTHQTMSTYYYLSNAEYMEVYGFAAGIGTRLKWPDNRFVFYNELSLQRYRLKNWHYYFLFSDGTSNNFSWKINLRRTSTDYAIYPRQGSEFVLGLQLTPPYSYFRSKDTDYQSMPDNEKYKWIEYHKWTIQGTLYTKLGSVFGKDLVVMTRAYWGYLGYYNKNLGHSPFEGFQVGGDGMTGYNTYGADIVGLRGYGNQSLTPLVNNAYAGNVYDKFTVELRLPVILEPSSTIYLLTFLEGGNCWSDIRQFNPFSIKRSAGIGARIMLPIVGMLGIDWGYGFDYDYSGKRGGSNFHFMIGQQF